MYIKYQFLIVGLLLCPLLFINAQTYETRTITNLDKKVAESSGLLILDGKFITFNDSGGEPELYEIDSTNGKIKRTIEIKDANNHDWEAITYDDKFIYIGDIGNNSGDRKNLKIYIISIADFWNKDKVKAKEIDITYAQQTSFEKLPHQTMFDAEAIIAVDERIILFSKNWQSNTSYIYDFPKEEGTYTILPKDSIVLPGKVCGATFDKGNRNIFLIGHSFEVFLSKISSFDTFPLKKERIFTTSISTASSIQTEGIALWENDVYYTSEYFKLMDLKGVLGHIPFVASLGNISNSSDFLEVQELSTQYLFKCSNYSMKTIEVFDNKGELIVSKKRIKKSYLLEKSLLAPGTYQIHVLFSNKEAARVKIIIE